FPWGQDTAETVGERTANASPLVLGGAGRLPPAQLVGSTEEAKSRGLVSAEKREYQVLPGAYDRRHALHLSWSGRSARCHVGRTLPPAGIRTLPGFRRIAGPALPRLQHDIRRPVRPPIPPIRLERVLSLDRGCRGLRWHPAISLLQARRRASA